MDWDGTPVECITLTSSRSMEKSIVHTTATWVSVGTGSAGRCGLSESVRRTRQAIASDFHVAVFSNSTATYVFTDPSTAVYIRIFGLAIRFTAILNLALIPKYGYLGAGVATAISYVTLNLLYSAQLYRETGIHPYHRTCLSRSGRGYPRNIHLLGDYQLPHRHGSRARGDVRLLHDSICRHYPSIWWHRRRDRDRPQLQERFDIDLGPLKEIAERLIW